eukprot:TRINITY_DN2328_c0_g1_i1.p1 TRINITY_DN2328_c0_g1~~TRINITY_DN2328_c0_g1_i1.p1  ORF type:complete len:1257 (-),score=304.91 TRINITY_DN2328_c0_g1_i1:433-3879(-)
MEHLAFRINKAAAEIARGACEKVQKADGKRRFVAGAVGPTNRTASISPSVEHPDVRNVTYDQLVEAYGEQIRGLVAGGVDVLMIETIFDTLNAKAAIFACLQYFEDTNSRIPIMISGTITDASGRTLSGQTTEAFYTSVRHAQAISIGLNCALGAAQMRPFLAKMAEIAECLVSVYPNAGLPNAMGEYDQGPEDMAPLVEDFLVSGFVNIVGGCCGTTPPHIAAIARVAAKHAPRPPPQYDATMVLSGMERLRFDKSLISFLNIGERCNVAGSIKFKNLIKQNKFEEAVAIAREQVESGAQILDINMDDGLLDGPACMTKFLNMLAGDDDVCKVPFCVDSSKFPICEAGLKCIQGKPIVNSISLKNGEAEFRKEANILRKYGCAVVVMAFDENGQATETEDKVRICKRSYKILTEEVGFPGEDIIFDPNILTIATGMEEHNNYAVNFIDATRILKHDLPLCKVSGGLSNLSFSFRSLETIRQAMHSVFLYHGIAVGMDMAIVNAGALPPYTEIKPELLKLCEDVILNKHDGAAEAMTAFAEVLRQTKDVGAAKEQTEEEWRKGTVQERLAHALIKGNAQYVEQDVDEARLMRDLYPQTLNVIEGPLLAGMATVGELFGSGKMFLPQVIKSARVMKKAVAVLLPYLEAEKAQAIAEGKVEDKESGKVLLATVKGDVHDIGKNIVGVVLGCNNYQVTDMGVMVPCEKILDKAIEIGADVIGLSGLITPSLDEMVTVAREMARRGMTTPLLIGGATTSKMHTAVKIHPHYKHGVVHVLDASKSVVVVSSLLGENKRDFLEEVDESYEELRHEHLAGLKERKYLTLADARAKALKIDFAAQPPAKRPSFLGEKALIDYSLTKCRERIDWNPFFSVWQLRGKYPNRGYPKLFNDEAVGAEAKKLYGDAQAMLDDIIANKRLTAKGVVGFYPANAVGDDIEVYEDDTRQTVRARFHGLRQQALKENPNEPYLSLSDFVAPKGHSDYIGLFAVAVFGAEEGCKKYEQDHDDYSSILLKALADRLAEAFAESLHEEIRRELWGYQKEESLNTEAMIKQQYQGIRPAPGYPSQPDHWEKDTMWKLSRIEELSGIQLSESHSMLPAAATCALVFAHPSSKYFAVGKITKDQVEDYAARKTAAVESVERSLGSILGYDA